MKTATHSRYSFSNLLTSTPHSSTLHSSRYEITITLHASLLFHEDSFKQSWRETMNCHIFPSKLNFFKINDWFSKTFNWVQQQGNHEMGVGNNLKKVLRKPINTVRKASNPAKIWTECLRNTDLLHKHATFFLHYKWQQFWLTTVKLHKDTQ
jgi:hypothetical protein